MDREEENKAKHKEFRMTVFKYKSDNFYLSEVRKAMLESYGSWFQALEEGEILPYTIEQENFINGKYEGNLDPKHNEKVAVWIKYKKSKERHEEFEKRIEKLEKQSEETKKANSKSESES